MIKINFYPESDRVDYTEGVKEYEQIWKDEGERIINKWEEVTGLKFKETEINAIIGPFRSCSHPLTLRFNLPFKQKHAVLVHEIGHRILFGNTIHKHTLHTHKILFLVLWDVFIELYGQELLDVSISFDKDREMALSSDSRPYTEAWDWSMQYKTKEERQEMFRKILSGEIKLV